MLEAREVFKLANWAIPGTAVNLDVKCLCNITQELTHVCQCFPVLECLLFSDFQVQINLIFLVH
jgi:hypothetical protein